LQFPGKKRMTATELIKRNQFSEAIQSLVRFKSLKKGSKHLKNSALLTKRTKLSTK
jgi:hypothetical protein